MVSKQKLEEGYFLGLNRLLLLSNFKSVASEICDMLFLGIFLLNLFGGATRASYKFLILPILLKAAIELADDDMYAHKRRRRLTVGPRADAG